MNPLSLFSKHKQIWPSWPSSCNTHPKTLSFRATNDPNKEPFIEAELAEVTTFGSCFTNSSNSPSISTDSDCSAVETIVRGAASEQRLFFEPDATSSILDQVLQDQESDMYKESVAMVVETEDPYGDFRKSMEEMVENYGLKDWDSLEALLGWYLRMNEVGQHEFIVGAFLDLLVGISGGGGGDHGGGGGEGEGSDLCIESLTSDASSACSCSSPILSSTNGN